MAENITEKNQLVKNLENGSRFSKDVFKHLDEAKARYKRVTQDQKVAEYSDRVQKKGCGLTRTNFPHCIL